MLRDPDALSKKKQQLTSLISSLNELVLGNTEVFDWCRIIWLYITNINSIGKKQHSCMATIFLYSIETLP